MWVFMFFLLRKMVSMTSQLQDFYTKKENNGREMKIATELQHEQQNTSWNRVLWSLRINQDVLRNKQFFPYQTMEFFFAFPRGKFIQAFLSVEKRERKVIVKKQAKEN